MAYSEIIEEAKTLSDSNMAEVLDFIKFLKNKQTSSVKHRTPGLLKGKLKFIADDFDETLDCFKEYM